MIDKPIFVVGVGRSGSTLFHRMFSEHPHVAWMTQLSARYPDRLVWQRAFLHGIDLPLLRRLLRHYIKPAESYGFWNRSCPGFATTCRDLRADDATNAVKARLQRAASALLTARRPRLLAKTTGWPRFGFLHAIFPDARFIHIYRDGRAVASSLLQTNFWRGREGPTQWRWGELSPELQDEWKMHDRSFVALAGIQWKLLMRAAEAARPTIPPGQVMDLRYEDFVARPIETFRNAIRFCELEWTVGFERALRRYRVRADGNAKWRDELDAPQQAILVSVLATELRKYGYG